MIFKHLLTYLNPSQDKYQGILRLEIKKKAETVILLQQLDDRYLANLQPHFR